MFSNYQKLQNVCVLKLSKVVERMSSLAIKICGACVFLYYQKLQNVCFSKLANSCRTYVLSRAIKSCLTKFMRSKPNFEISFIQHFISIWISSPKYAVFLCQRQYSLFMIDDMKLRTQWSPRVVFNWYLNKMAMLALYRPPEYH